MQETRITFTSKDPDATPQLFLMLNEFFFVVRDPLVDCSGTFQLLKFNPYSYLDKLREIVYDSPLVQEKQKHNKYEDIRSNNTIVRN